MDMLKPDMPHPASSSDMTPDLLVGESTLGAELTVHFGKLALLWVAAWLIWRTGFHGQALQGWDIALAWLSVSLIGQISFVLRRWLITLSQPASGMLYLVFSAEVLGIVQSIRWLG